MAKMMSIQVRKCRLRSKPSFMGRVIAALAYGDRVSVTGEQDDWYEVAPLDRGKGGWVHSSALSVKEIILRPGSRDMENIASGEELALAGKGFNEQVEKDFRKKNRNIDFTWIDAMEKIVITPGAIQKFLRQGELHQESGEA